MTTDIFGMLFPGMKKRDVPKGCYGCGWMGTDGAGHFCENPATEYPYLDCPPIWDTNTRPMWCPFNEE